MLRALAVLALLVAPFAAAEPLLLRAPCSALAPLADASCAPIHPGAGVWLPGAFCTMNFVVTDGVELYVGTAGHCVSGKGGRARVAGGLSFGAVVLDGARGDWAFIRVDAEDREKVDPTLAQWGGPTGVRAPLLAGEVVFHYGHGASLGQIPETRGRAGEVLLAGAESSSFLYAGSVDSGDSGSPVLLATGEAAGIAVATIFLEDVPVPVTFASRFDLAVDELSDALGKPVVLVSGAPLVQCACPAASPPAASV